MEKEILASHMWDEKGVINRNIIAKKATEIASLSGLDAQKFSNSAFLMVMEESIGKQHLFSMEKLSPVLAVYRASDFDHALELAK